MTGPIFHKPAKFSAVLATAISEYNEEFDLNSAAKPLAYLLASSRRFGYARHDPRSRKARGPRGGVVTPEIRAYAGALVLCGWVAWVHNSKDIWHFTETSVNGEIFLNHEFMPNLMKAIGVGKAKASLDKISEGRFQPEFRIDKAVKLLRMSLSD